jgi:hypothetical protein
MYFIMIIYILIFIIVAPIIFYYYFNYIECFDLYTREGEYTASMFGSRDIPIHLCSKIV